MDLSKMEDNRKYERELNDKGINIIAISVVITKFIVCFFHSKPLKKI